MATAKTSKVSTLKWVHAPKKRGKYAELKEFDLDKLTPREQVLFRVINALEDEIDKSKAAAKPAAAAKAKTARKATSTKGSAAARKPKAAKKAASAKKAPAARKAKAPAKKAA